MKTGSQEEHVDSVFRSINEALTFASDGDCIIVHPGTYKESLFVDKSVNITGEGNKNTIIIENDDSDVITIASEYCSINNILVRHKGRGDFCAVRVNNQCCGFGFSPEKRVESRFYNFSITPECYFDEEKPVFRLRFSRFSRPAHF